MEFHDPDTWSNVAGVDYGADTISLNTIVPASGTRTSAYFSRSECLHAGATKNLLWRPPLSMYNGWSEQPSEIALSYVLVAHVSGVAESRERYGWRHDLEILSRKPLIELLQALDDDTRKWEMPSAFDGRRSHLIWDEIRWCGTAKVAGYLYVVAKTGNETHMELIAEEVEGELVGLLYIHSDPGGTTCDIGRGKLTAKESEAVRRAIDMSYRLNDMSGPYLAP
ncbi:hypothetical protein [Duganella sp. Root1480D1]|uniref:hypothetical protein n=1 Tax=Duganella sp. Root1480D1 TaxID=1736471 RepID=UPI0012E355E0|nr:hypothetical protein [Duganella sp. Root1480D1]